MVSCAGLRRVGVGAPVHLSEGCPAQALSARDLHMAQREGLAAVTPLDSGVGGHLTASLWVEILQTSKESRQNEGKTRTFTSYGS